MHLTIVSDCVKMQFPCKYLFWLPCGIIGPAYNAPIGGKKTHLMHWLVLYNDLLERLNQAFFTNDPKITDVLTAPGLITMDERNRQKYKLAQFPHSRFIFLFSTNVQNLKNVYIFQNQFIFFKIVFSNFVGNSKIVQYYKKSLLFKK